MIGPATLKAMREARGISQVKLARRAGLDNSYISRIEGGTRMPPRDILLSIATALQLNAGERGALVAAFGYVPDDRGVWVAGEPEIVRLYELMRGGSVPGNVRRMVRTQLAMIASQLEAR